VTLVDCRKWTNSSLLPVSQHLHSCCQCCCHSHISRSPQMPAGLGISSIRHLPVSQTVLRCFPHVQVPVLTRDTADHVPANGLVRFRGMVSHTQSSSSSSSNSSSSSDSSNVGRTLRYGVPAIKLVAAAQEPAAAAWCCYGRCCGHSTTLLSFTHNQTD
jgi:hypothetical protein